MLNILNIEENISEHLYYLSNLFDNEKYPDLHMNYQFIFSYDNKEYEYFITIKNSTVDYGKGTINNPDLTIITPLNVWYDISIGKISGSLALITGKYKIKGKLKYIKDFLKIFGKKFSENEIPGISDRIAPFEMEKSRVWKKPEKVLVINGSSRGKNGHTFLYLKHFIEGMESAGASVEIIDIYDNNLKISPCKGCEICWSSGKNECIINDDANEIVDKINDSYLTIYAFPLFVDSIPAKLKALLDRFFVILRPVFVPFNNKITRHPIYNKKERYMALFSVCGFPELEHFDPLVNTFKDISQNSHTPIIANILRPASQFFYKNPSCKFYLEEILMNLKIAGQQIIENGKVENKTLKNIQNDYNIPKKIWMNYSNMYWYQKLGRKDD